MPDEIAPDAPPAPPAVENEAPFLPADGDKVSGLGMPPGYSVPPFPAPVFDDSAPLPYAAASAAEPEAPALTPEQQLAANVQLIAVKLDHLNSQVTDLTSRVDWIAPRIEWIRSTFEALIQQFGKITPGQVFSMLRGKNAPAPTQEGQQS